MSTIVDNIIKMNINYMGNTSNVNGMNKKEFNRFKCFGNLEFSFHCADNHGVPQASSAGQSSQCHLI